eukprot:scaffold1509_cov240-Pinguiococcus_pyrenoidosus.AAC.12
MEMVDGGVGSELAQMWRRDLGNGFRRPTSQASGFCGLQAPLRAGPLTRAASSVLVMSSPRWRQIR